MKRLIFMLGLILLITGSSGATRIVLTTDYLNEPVVCIDSIPGTQGECDSAHVWTLFGNADYPCYFNRTTTIGTSWIDSVDYAGKLHASYRFFDAVADCDCDSGAGYYSMTVILYGSGVPTENSFSFQLVDSSFGEMLIRIGQMNYEVLKPTTATRKLDVTANGEAGIDLDNVSGTLDAGEIGADAITAAKIADDAIDYATFAATPPTAWWPEGKTGYTASLNSAQAGSLNTLMADVDGIKAKSDSSSYAAGGHIKSTPQTDVTLSGGTIGGIATANWAAGTRTLTTADWSTHSASDVVNEWETQSQADPTGFRVNVLEIEGVDATNQINAEADQALSDYDPPTRTEATADKDAVIVEVDANETKIDALNNLSVAEVWTYGTRVLTDTAGLSGLAIIVIDTTNLSGLVVVAKDTTNLSGLAVQVIDTTNLSVLTDKIETDVGANTDPASMSGSLFAGQQYIADNMGGGTSGCGAGVFACTLEVRDSSLQAGIHNIKITVRNHDQTATTVWGWTNPDGKIFFFLDSLQTDNSYKLWISSLDYNFTYPEALDLRSDTTAVYYGTAFDYGAPPADSSCAVIGQVFNTLVDSLSGVIVTFTLVAPDDSLIVYNGAIFSKYEVSDTTDASGRFRLDMLPEAVFDRPAGMLYYKAAIDYPVDWGGMVVEFDSVSVPIATSVDADEILH